MDTHTQTFKIKQQNIPSGWLVIDKPAGMTSAHVIERMRRILNIRRRHMKIGHAGTLDPMATGMLVIALGEATKLIEIAMQGAKTYTFAITFGQTRDTDDAEGEVIATSDKRPTLADIEATLPKFTGKIQQVPPNYSAIKVGGKRAYVLARMGKDMELKAREVEVFSLVASDEWLVTRKGTPSHSPLTTSHFTATCSKGTYIRSLARDMAAEMGCLGHISALRRLNSGNFTESMMISLEKLEDLVYKAQPLGVHAVDDVLDDILAIGLPPETLERVLHGNEVAAPPDLPQGLVRIKQGEKLIALYENASGRLKPVRVFNL